MVSNNTCIDLVEKNSQKDTGRGGKDGQDATNTRELVSHAGRGDGRQGRERLSISKRGNGAAASQRKEDLCSVKTDPSNGGKQMQSPNSSLNVLTISSLFFFVDT